MSDAERGRSVFVIQDAFTSFFDAPVAIAVIELIAALGYRPQVAPFSASGKPLHVKGFMPEFERTARRHARMIDELAAHGRPLVGIEPSVTLALATDYRHAIGRALPVQPFEQWLGSALTEHAPTPGADVSTGYRLLNHCTARTESSASNRAWQKAFAQFGLGLETADVGCCGMSGAYGHEARHRETSEAVFDLSWSNALAQGETSQPLVPGYSCRSQIARLRGKTALHPAQALLARIGARAALVEPALAHPGACHRAHRRIAWRRDDTIAARFLGVVECCVGRRSSMSLRRRRSLSFWAIPIERVTENCDAALAGEDQFGRAPAQSFGGFHRPLEIGGRHDPQKLLAAEAAEAVDLAHAVGHVAAEPLEHLVAHGVTMRVVDALEMVDIDHADTEHIGRTLAAGAFAIEHFHQPATVVQPGQVVAHGHHGNTRHRLADFVVALTQGSAQPVDQRAQQHDLRHDDGQRREQHPVVE